MLIPTRKTPHINLNKGNKETFSLQLFNINFTHLNPLVVLGLFYVSYQVVWVQVSPGLVVELEQLLLTLHSLAACKRINQIKFLFIKTIHKNVDTITIE